MSLYDLCALGKLWDRYDGTGDLRKMLTQLRGFIADPNFWDAEGLVAARRPAVRLALGRVVAMTMKDAKSQERGRFLRDINTLHAAVEALLKLLENALSQPPPRGRALLARFRKNLNEESALLEVLRDTAAGYSARAFGVIL